MTNFFSDFLWKSAGLRNFARHTALRWGTKFDPLYLGRFWRYPYEFLKKHRQAGALPNKS